MATPWKTVRVFVSSTFKDMHAERDYLVRITFPELAERMRARRLQLVPVDLRWGVTDEQDALEICLDEIESCRPRFIGILGGRYGWVPAGREESITAAEIMRGVLEDPAKGRYSFFYLRDPRVTEAIAGESAADFREPAGSDGEARLAALKHRIVDEFLGQAGHGELAGDHREPAEDRIRGLQSGGVSLRASVYSCEWNPELGIHELEAFGRQVLEDLWQTIEEEFPKASIGVTDPVAEEQEALEFFVQARTRFFVGRQGVLNRLTAFADGSEPARCLILPGPSGCGKSSLLANFLAGYPAHNPEAVVVGHFAGMSGRAASSYWIARRFVEEIQAATGRGSDVPVDMAGIRRRLEQLLEGAARPSVLVLDGLDQLDSDGQYLTWLPESLPARVRVLASVLKEASATTLEAIRSRFPSAVLELEPLASSESRQIVEAVLRSQRRSLSPSQMSLLLAIPAADNPLYLRVALEELAIRSRYESLEADIARLPANIRGLFEALLERLEKDHDPALVRELTSALAAASGGLTEAELLAAIGRGLGQPVPPLHWARLRRALAPHLVSRSELTDFAHRELLESVVRRYLSQEGSLAAAHSRLADTFAAMGWAYQRSLLNLPGHLAKAGRDQDLIELMDGAFPDAVLEGVGSAAELARDYDLALDACERQRDLTHGLRFTLNRSRLELETNWLSEPGVAGLLSRVAAKTADPGVVLRAEAIVLDLETDRARQARAWLELASSLPEDEHRERLLSRAEQAMLGLAPGTPRDGLALAYLKAALDGPDPSLSRAGRALETIGGAQARGEAARLLAAALWAEGHREAARRVLEEVRGAPAGGDAVLDLAARLWKQQRDFDAVLAAFDRELEFGRWERIAERDLALAAELDGAALVKFSGAKACGVAALRSAAAAAGGARAARRARVLGRFPVFSRNALQAEERRALGVLAGRHSTVEELRRVRDAEVRRAAAGQRDPQEASELLRECLDTRAVAELRETVEAAVAAATPELAGEAAAAWKKSATGATERDWLGNLRRRRWREILIGTGVATGLALVFVGVLVGVGRMFWIWLSGIHTGLEGSGKAVGLGSRIAMAVLVYYMFVLIPGPAVVCGVKYAVLGWLRWKHPDRFARRVLWLIGLSQSAPARPLWRRGLRRLIDFLDHFTWLNLDKVDFLLRYSRRRSRERKLSTLSSYLKCLPPGPQSSALVHETFRLAERNCDADMAAEMVAAAASIDPEGVLPLARRAALLCTDAEEAPYRPNENKDLRRLKLDQAWVRLAGVVATRDREEGLRWLERRLEARARKRSEQAAGFVAAIDDCGARVKTEAAAVFWMLKWLSGQPPEAMAEALQNVVEGTLVARLFPPAQVRAARRYTGYRAVEWVPLVVVAPVVYAAVLWGRYQTAVHWHWRPLARGELGTGVLLVDLAIECGVICYFGAALLACLGMLLYALWKGLLWTIKGRTRAWLLAGLGGADRARASR